MGETSTASRATGPTTGRQAYGHGPADRRDQAVSPSTISATTVAVLATTVSAPTPRPS
jgi:hypothetical protein